MTARADASLQIEASCEFEVIAPELQLTIEGPQRRFLERPATYRVSVDNPGTASAKDVQLVTHLPKGMQFVSATTWANTIRLHTACIGVWPNCQPTSAARSSSSPCRSNRWTDFADRHDGRSKDLKIAPINR